MKNAAGQDRTQDDNGVWLVDIYSTMYIYHDHRASKTHDTWCMAGNTKIERKTAKYCITFLFFRNFTQFNNNNHINFIFTQYVNNEHNYDQQTVN